MNNPKRIYQIDLFRFLAAMAVVLYHYLFRGYAAGDLSVINFGETGEFFKYGYLGVDLFFIISGFVITLSIKHNSLTKFIISRFTRLYPAYWLCVILTFIIIIFFGMPRYEATFNQLLYNLTMFQDHFGVDNIDGAYWSLFVELKFYIIIGFFLFANKFIKVSLDYLIISWLILTFVSILASDTFFIRAADFFLFFVWSSYFIAGMVFYQVFKKGYSFKYLAILLCCLSISLYYALSKIGVMGTKYNSFFSPYIISIIIISFYVLMFLVSINKLNFINSSKLIKIGALTYPLYLLHSNIGFIIFNNFNIHLNKYLLLFLTILLMLFFSYLISEKIEPLIQKSLRKKITQFVTKFKLN